MKKYIDKKNFDKEVYFDFCFGRTYESKFIKKLYQQSEQYAKKRWFKLNLRLRGYRAGEQILNNLSGYEWNSYHYLFTTKCRYCRNEVERDQAVITHGYWTAGRDAPGSDNEYARTT